MRGSARYTVQPPSHLYLLGRFNLVWAGEVIELNMSARRIFAYIGIIGRPTARVSVAQALWGGRAGYRAQGNLRSSLWRLPEVARPAITDKSGSLALDPEMKVDVHELVIACRAILGGIGSPSVPSVTVDLLSDDLLPGWEDDWALVERYRLRQLTLHALEALSSRLLGAGRMGEALDAANAALARDGLRGSAARAVVAAHLSSGNVAAARRVFEEYRDRVRQELGIEPPKDMLEGFGRKRLSDDGAATRVGEDARI
jgi:DNA-binding SARP family transcriptional activator